MITLNDLPAPPAGKSGFPWTQGSPNTWREPLKISVITPSYNQGDYLEETIRSVLLQGYENLEYILIDGGSTDDSVAIIEKYAPWIDYWVSEKDQGQTDAINKGFAQATGDVMGWLNSDDLLLPDALGNIAKAYHDPSVMATCGFRRLIDPQSDLIVNWVRGFPRAEHLKLRNIVGQETAYWRRELWQELGKLDESLHFCMDYEYWERILAAGYEFHMIPHFIGGFRQHPESKTSNLEAVHKADLKIVYQRYGLATDEADALQKLGWAWRARYDLTKDLCHQAIFDDPQRATKILRLIETPIISLPILALYRLYRAIK